MPTEKERFWSKVSIGNDCWEWQASKDVNGYGFFGFRNRIHLAHRVAYMLWHNVTLTKEQKVLHTCDNPCCCNPKHLFIGTDKINNHDKCSKFRGTTKLDKTTCNLIVKDAHFMTTKELARKYNISVGTVSNIRNNKYAPLFGPKP